MLQSNSTGNNPSASRYFIAKHESLLTKCGIPRLNIEQLPPSNLPVLDKRHSFRYWSREDPLQFSAPAAAAIRNSPALMEEVQSTLAIFDRLFRTAVAAIPELCGRRLSMWLHDLHLDDAGAVVLRIHFAVGNLSALVYEDPLSSAPRVELFKHASISSKVVLPANRKEIFELIPLFSHDTLHEAGAHFIMAAARDAAIYRERLAEEWFEGPGIGCAFSKSHTPLVAKTSIFHSFAVAAIADTILNQKQIPFFQDDDGGVLSINPFHVSRMGDALEGSSDDGMRQLYYVKASATYRNSETSQNVLNMAGEYCVNVRMVESGGLSVIADPARRLAS